MIPLGLETLFSPHKNRNLPRYCGRASIYHISSGNRITTSIASKSFAATFSDEPIQNNKFARHAIPLCSGSDGGAMHLCKKFVRPNSPAIRSRIVVVAIDEGSTKNLTGVHGSIDGMNVCATISNKERNNTAASWGPAKRCSWHVPPQSYCHK